MARRPRFRKALQEGQRQIRRQTFAQALTNPGTTSVADASRKIGISAEHGYRILRQPQFQNMLTEALDRAELTDDEIVKPILDGLKANIVVKHSETLSAKVTKVADLEFRGKTFDRIVNLRGLGARHQDDIPAQAPTPIFNFIRVEAPTHKSTREELPNSPPAITATFTREE